MGEEKHLESLGILSFANLTATYLINNAIVCQRIASGWNREVCRLGLAVVNPSSPSQPLPATALAINILPASSSTIFNHHHIPRLPPLGMFPLPVAWQNTTSLAILLVQIIIFHLGPHVVVVTDPASLTPAFQRNSHIFKLLATMVLSIPCSFFGTCRFLLSDFVLVVVSFRVLPPISSSQEPASHH